MERVIRDDMIMLPAKIIAYQRPQIFKLREFHTNHCREDARLIFSSTILHEAHHPPGRDKVLDESDALHPILQNWPLLLMFGLHRIRSDHLEIVILGRTLSQYLPAQFITKSAVFIMFASDCRTA